MEWLALSLAAPAAAAPAPLEIGGWALQFTPRVALVEEASMPPALLLDIASTLRLWGGRAALIGRIAEEGHELGVSRVVHGPTGAIALARLWGGAPHLSTAIVSRAKDCADYATDCTRHTKDCACHATGHTSHTKDCTSRITDCAAHADALPLRLLPAAGPHLDTLVRLGCTTWGDLRRLPRAGLVRRFGAPLLEALDTAYGARPDLRTWLTLPDLFDVRHELPAAVEEAPALVFAARRLFKLLAAWLVARQHGVAACRFVWDTGWSQRDRATGDLRLRTAQATQDMAHLERLLSEQLQRVRLPAPAYALRLVTLETEPFCPPTANLLAPHRAGGKPMEPLHQFIEKISARLGPQAIQRIRLQADYRPEAQHAAHEAGGNAGSNAGGNTGGNAVGNVGRAASALVGSNNRSAARGASRSASHGGQDSPKAPRKKSSNPNKPAPPATHPLAAFLPTWLLPTPLKLPMDGDFPAYRGALQLLHGPQRLETSTLVDAAAAPDSAVARDYFMAWNAQAGLVWVYRERATAGAAWYLHGLYA